MAADPLERLRDFVNTYDAEHGRDAIASPAALTAWLTTHGLGAPRAVAADVRRAATLRDAMLAHLLANNGEPLTTDAFETLDRQAARSRVLLGFAARGGELHPTATGVDGALGVLLADAATAMADGSWDSLKACRAEDCRWAFVDRSRNRSRHWCAMGVCGNRAKVRRYRARHTGS